MGYFARYVDFNLLVKNFSKMPAVFKKPVSLKRPNRFEIMGKMRVGKICNACCIGLYDGKNKSRVKKQQKNRARTIKISESELNLNIAAAILSRNFDIFDESEEIADSHRYTNVDRLTICSLCHAKSAARFKGKSFTPENEYYDYLADHYAEFTDNSSSEMSSDSLSGTSEAPSANVDEQRTPSRIEIDMC